MNEMRLSVTTKKLLASAKADGPSAAARANMWSSVAGAIGGAAGAGASGASAAVAVGGATGGKLLVIGTLFGGTMAVGLATAFLRLGTVPAPPSASTPSPPIRQDQGTVATGLPAAESNAAIGATDAPRPDLSDSSGVLPPSNSIVAPSGVRLHAHAKAPSAASHEDVLAREASLVTSARNALLRSDPRSALHAIRAARALPSKQLVPEELAVEGQALRALGRNDEANGIEVELRLEYPEAALAR